MTVAYLPERPATARWLSPAEKARLIDLLKVELVYDARGDMSSVRRALVSPAVLRLCLCYFGVEIALYGVIFWIPQIFREMHIQPPLLGWAVAIPYACAALGMLWWSRHSDRRSERLWHLLAASFAGFLGLALSAVFARSPAISLLAITVGATGTLAVLPIFWTQPPALLGGAAAAGAIALINAVGNLGGFVGPYVIGVLKDATGRFTSGLLVAAAGVLSTGILTILLSPRPVSRDATGMNR
jgi:MFS transporter, ACS family, tartrate transporter